MTNSGPTRPDPAGAGGALLAVCGGYRCAGLHRGLVGEDDGLEDLRSAVRSTTGAVLLLMPCMDSCSHGPVVGVGRYLPPRGPGLRLAAPATLFGPVGDGPARRELRDWVLSGGAGESAVPPALAECDISPVMGWSAAPVPPPEGTR